MREGMEDLIYDVEQQEQQRECEGRTGRCPQCERQGFPILPVRYAVCKRVGTNHDIPELPAERVKEFTNITLDKALENGIEVEKTLDRSVIHHVNQAKDGKVCKYILSQLRPGYFYVFDQNNPPYYWYAYVVSEEGTFHQYSVREVPPLPKDASFSCITAPEDERRPKALSASIVTLPRVAKGDVFYYAYTEHAWSREHLSMIEGDADWRDKNMQRFAISSEGSVSGQDHTYRLDQLNLVAEFNGGSVERTSSLRDSGGKRRLFSQQDMIDNMKDRLHRHADWLQGQELIIAVKDEAAIIDELNFYRMSPINDLRHYLAANNKENQRKLLILQALEAFKENFRHTQEKDIAEKYAVVESPYEETRRWELEQMKRAAELTDDEAARAILEERIARIEAEDGAARQRREGARDRELEGVDDTVKDWESQIRDLYDENRIISYYDRNIGLLEDFKREYTQMAESCESLVAAFDADYAFWIRDHLTSVIDRTSDTDFRAGVKVSSIIASLLTGGILSPSSFCVWEGFYQQLTAADSVIVRGLFFNQSALIRAAVRDANNIEEGRYLGGGKLNEWKNRFNQFFAPYEGNENQANYLAQQVLPALVGLSGNSVASVALQKEAAERDILTTFIRYAQILYCMQEDVRRGPDKFDTDGVQGGRAPTLQMMEVDMNSEAVCQWLLHMSRQNQMSSRNLPIDSVMEFPEGDGGNITVAPPMDSGAVDLTINIPVTYLDDARIDEVDQEDLKKWREDNLLSEVSVGKSVVGLATAKSISRNALADPVGKALISLVSILESIKVLFDESLGKVGKEGEKTDWAKIAAATATLVKSGVELRQGALEVRAALMAWDAMGHLPPAGSTSVLGVALEKVTLIKVVGAVADAVSFYEGMNAIAQTGHERDQGQSSEVAAAGYFGGTLKVLGALLGFAGLIGGGFPLAIVGFFFAVCSLLLGKYFVKLVPPAVWMWVNRSLIGNHVGYIAPFKGAEEEMASLELVFKGVTVDISKRDIVISEGINGERIIERASWADHPDIVVLNPPNGKNITVKVIVPNLDSIRLVVSLMTITGVTDAALTSRTFEKRTKDDKLKEDFSTSRGSRGGVVNVELMPGNFISVECAEIFSRTELGHSISISISFGDLTVLQRRVKGDFEIAI